ncbi:MAG: hypothetical protein OHK0039_00680 [Bacteroidia bacterium]
MKIALFITLSLLWAGTASRLYAQQDTTTHHAAMTNIRSLYEPSRPVSAKPLFKGQEATTTALHIQQHALLPEHSTPVPALLVCVSGEVVFENEKGLRQTLTPGDYLHIEPVVKHWVTGVQDSQLLLIK